MPKGRDGKKRGPIETLPALARDRLIREIVMSKSMWPWSLRSEI
jgi:hypothetical protein